MTMLGGLRGAVAALGVLGAATAASAADLPTKKDMTPVVAPEPFDPFFVKVAFTYVLNTSSSKLWSQDPTAMAHGNFGTFPTGFGATIGDVATVGFEAGWFVTRNVSLDVSLGIPYSVDVKSKGYNPSNPLVPNGTVLAKITPAYVPITALWHFDQFGAFRPYLGAGFAPGFNMGSKNALLTGVHVGNSIGLVLQAGADYMLTRNWGLTADVKKTFSYVQSHQDGIDLAGAMLPVQSYQHTHFQPWAFSAGVVYRFGG
jgi:outer membrane protein